VLARADVLRADAAEAALLVGRELADVEAVRGAAAQLLAAGPRLVSLAAGEDGDLVAWRAGPSLVAGAGPGEADLRWADGDVLVPHLGREVVDPTGGRPSLSASALDEVVDRDRPT
jgi:ribokinase